MSKYKKIAVIFMILILAIIFTTGIFAATITTGTITKDKNLGDADTGLETMGTKIFTAVSNVGVAVSVVVIAYIGVRYMIGSADEKAEYKKTMMPYLVGALLIFGASAIGKVVYTIFSKI